MKKIVLLTTVALVFAAQANAQVATTGGGTVQTQGGNALVTKDTPVVKPAPAKTAKHTVKHTTTKHTTTTTKKHVTKKAPAASTTSSSTTNTTTTTGQ